MIIGGGVCTSIRDADTGVEPFVAEASVEACDIAVLHRPARLDIKKPDGQMEMLMISIGQEFSEVSDFQEALTKPFLPRKQSRENSK